MTRDHILLEIRRTADANGGSPLGWRRFAEQTGIREADWIGKYWARWSDALREAGLQPNQLQGAIETGKLLEQYATLACELGRLPTANDLRLKDRTDPSYPNQKVFERLGKKSEVVRMLVDHCRNRPEYQSVIPMCEEYVARAAPAKADSGGSVANGDDIGDVYLMKSGRFYKIGRSNAHGRREYEIALQLPERLITVHVIRTDDPPGIEAYWHRRFEPKRKNGEWFELDPQDIAAFKRRKFM